MSLEVECDTSLDQTDELIGLARNGEFGFIDEGDFNVVKSREGCVVLETEAHFYKIIRLDAPSKIDCFEQFVRNAIAQEMKARGVEWDVFVCQVGGEVFSVEKRQRLKTVNENELTCDDVLKKSRAFTTLLEKRLELPRLTAQLHAMFSDDGVEKIVLSRDVPFEYADFAWANVEVVPLSSSRWFLALLGDDGKWKVQTPADVLPVKLKFGDFFFARKDLFDQVMWAIGALFEPTSKWWLFDKNACDAQQARNSMIDEVKEMYDTNLKIAVTKKPIKVDSAEIHGSMLQECERLGLKSADGVKLLHEKVS